MLYVFHVDAGQMTKYDMSLTLQTVSKLKLAIASKTRVPSNLLVLLVSGGEVLESDHMVSSYSAGTDTNPIYMFSKPSMKESHLRESMCNLSPIVELSTNEFSSEIRSIFEGKSYAELKAAVEKCCTQLPTVSTVITCATLAQQFSDSAQEVSSSCEQLVHEQHLQHQGWAAVVANLEDINNEFCERSRSFKEAFRKHRLKKNEYHEKLNGLNEVLESLGRVPILPALRLNAEAHRFSAFDIFEDTDFEGHHYSMSNPLDNSSDNKACQDFGVDAFKLSDDDVFSHDISLPNEGASSSEPVPPHIKESDEGATFKVQPCDTKEEPTLLHWILAQGNKASLQDIIDYCQKGLALLSAEPLKEREAELFHILEYADIHGLKQLKGIEDRLYGLDQLLNEVKKIERDQRDQAASLIQYKERLNSTWDPSVLPTLVQSHWCQLKKLLKGHESLVDIRRRIANSKEELCTVLKARLQAVLMIENKMSVQDAHDMLSFQCFNRLSRYFSIVEQLHRAPQVFVRAVHEVARRRTFSEAHIKWAINLAEKLQLIHEEEVNRRQDFNAIFEGHFLRSLFPGMLDLPPFFATQIPPIYDSNLPKLADSDVQLIDKAFPDVAIEVPNYDMESTVQFFYQRMRASESESKDADIQVDMEKVLQSLAEAGDFDKLSEHCDQKVDISTSCVPDTMAVSTVTEDNMDSHKINVDKLQDFLFKLYHICKMNIVYIIEELTKLKNDVDEQKKFITSSYLDILAAWNTSNEENALRFREQTQRLTVDHELELSDMKANLNEKDEVISTLTREIEDLKVDSQKEVERLKKEHQDTRDLLEKTREEILGFGNRLEEIEVQKQKEIRDMQEKMHQDYKAEIESLRSRFRLVALTNMDRSPSESSLEKIERTDVIEITNHNAIIMQTKENAEVEKEEAVKQALAKSELEWKQKLDAELAALKTKYEAEKQVSVYDVSKRLLCEKDRQLEALREREAQLARECTKYKETIQQLTDPETNDIEQLLKTQFASLENEKALLQQQVVDLKKELAKKNEEVDKSEKSKEEDSDSRSSPKKEEVRKSRIRSHTPCGLSTGTLSLSSCLPGHTVLVMWEPSHQNYTVLQEASVMYFVHSDCLPALGLSLQVKNENERKLYTIATVESKEFCYAKRDVNRYRMPQGARFYRVRVCPPAEPTPAPACCEQKHRSDSKKSVDTSQSTSSTIEQSVRAPEVATATLINLESPNSSAEVPTTTTFAQSEDQLDSIEASEHWQGTRMHLSSVSAMTDMESSVGRCLGEPLELTVSSISVIARGDVTGGSELAEEATP